MRSTLRAFVWNTKMAGVSLFWNTNMAAATSCENALYSGRFVHHLVYHRIEVSWYRDLGQICHSAHVFVLMLMFMAIKNQA